MTPEDWKKRIGEHPFKRVTWMREGPDFDTQAGVVAAETTTADLLDTLVELGWSPPPGHVRVSPTGTQVLLPHNNAEPVLTGLGLLRHWRARGHGWFIMRTKQLAKALTGPLMVDMQRISRAYEQECIRDSEDPIPADWHGFVGGTKASPADQILYALREEVSAPTVERATKLGPDQR